MMDVRRLISILFTIVSTGLVSGCSTPVSVFPPETRPGLNLIIRAEGDVLLKRDGWTGFHPTSFGAMLHRGDQLQPVGDARVVVLCENLTTWTVPGGSPSGLNNGCPQASEPALVSAGGQIAGTRGGTDPLIPYIMTPRSTRLLDPMPVLRWNAVPGAKTYTLRIRGTNWTAQMEATEFNYPGTPALRPGIDYLLVIETDNGRSSNEEGLPDLGFSLLTEAEAARVRADAARLDALNLPEEATAFALAQLYAGNGLSAEAIELLEESSASSGKAANMYRTLGELYHQVGLLLEAELRYLQAVDLAEEVGDIESATLAKARLGEVYLALGNKNRARGWLAQAQTGYEDLGDSQLANQIAARLAEWDR